MIYIEYFILATIVVYLSIFLSKYIDELDKKTNLSGAFIGGILLAAATSLPEFVTSLTAIFNLNQPSLVQGNVLGSNIFNLSILAACILIFSKKFKDNPLSKAHVKTAIFTILMFIISFIGIKYKITFNLGFFNVNIASILILILYIINIKNMNEDTSEETKAEAKTDLSVKQICVRFTIFTVFLVIASVLLTNVTDRLNEKLNLGSTIGGAIFLGIATSLPELASSFNLVRLGNFNASFGNIIGSNLFNFTIFSISDFFYSKGSIFIEDRQSYNLIFLSIISTILIMGTIYFRKKPKIVILLSVLTICVYISSIIFSV